MKKTPQLTGKISTNNGEINIPELSKIYKKALDKTQLEYAYQLSLHLLTQTKMLNSFLAVSQLADEVSITNVIHIKSTKTTITSELINYVVLMIYSHISSTKGEHVLCEIKLSYIGTEISSEESDSNDTLTQEPQDIYKIKFVSKH